MVAKHALLKSLMTIESGFFRIILNTSARINFVLLRQYLRSKSKDICMMCKQTVLYRSMPNQKIFTFTQLKKYDGTSSSSTKP